MSAKLNKNQEQLPVQPPTYEGDDPYGVHLFNTDELGDTTNSTIDPIDSTPETEVLDTENEANPFQKTGGRAGLALRGVRRFISELNSTRKERKDFKLRRKVFGIKRDVDEAPLELTKGQRKALKRMHRAGKKMEKLDHKIALYDDLGKLALTGTRGQSLTRDGELAMPRTKAERMAAKRIHNQSKKIRLAKGRLKSQQTFEVKGMSEREKQKAIRKVKSQVRKGEMLHGEAEKQINDIIYNKTAYNTRNVNRASTAVASEERALNSLASGRKKQEKRRQKRDEAVYDIQDAFEEYTRLGGKIHGEILEPDTEGYESPEIAPEFDTVDSELSPETGRELPFRVVKPIRIDSDEDGAPRVEIPKVKLPDEAEAGDGSDKPKDETSTEEDVRAKSEAEKINEQDLKKGDIITTDKFGEESEWTVHSYNESTGKILITRPANDGSGTRVGEYVTIDQITGRKSKASGPKAKKQPTDPADSYEKLLDKFPNA